MAADVRRLREVQAKADIGGERCLEMLPCPLSRPVLATEPVWEAFPEVNRLAVSRLLGLLVERMVQAAVVSGGNGGERGERRSEAASGAGGGQGPALAS